MKKNKIGLGQYILAAVIMLLALAALLPVLLVLIASFSSEASIAQNGFTFFPSEWSLDAWSFLGSMSTQLIKSYGVTIFITVVGTFFSLFFISMLAYSLSRTQFKLRGFLVVYLLITMLFHGGQLSSYLVNTTIYGLKDNILVLCIPSISAMYVFMTRTYIQNNIGISLIEAAKIDGAGEFRSYLQVCLPLMPPVLASIGFMIAVNYWNAWEGAQLYMTTPDKFPLQLLLMKVENNINALGKIPPNVQSMLNNSIPSESTRMAMLFTVLGPIMIAYPFFQKYFVKGLTMGGVKG